MKAITIWQPWASLIMVGAKTIEWRAWYAPKSLHGQRIAIHAGGRKVEKVEVAQLITQLIREGRQIDAGEPVDHPTGLDILKSLQLLGPLMQAPGLLPLSCVLGTAVIREPQLAGALGYPVDSDRLDQQNWGWPLTDIEPFPRPRPLKGHQGFWNMPAAAEHNARLFAEAL